jgi:RimJ/RimL family protein N-acetyltransferase
VSRASFSTRSLTTDGFNRLAAGKPPEAGLELPAGGLSPPEVLAMLAGISGSLRESIEPNAWMVLDHNRIIALCSITRLVEPGVVNIGYGTAPGEEGRGAAKAAVAGVLAWSREDDRIRVVVAETGLANTASQRVLQANGFQVVGERSDAEDGDLLCWRWDKPAERSSGGA